MSDDDRVQMFALANADAEGVAQAIEQAYSTGGRGRGGEGGAQIRVAADPGTNTILVWAPPRVREDVAAHIQALDQQGAQMHAIDILQANPETVAATLLVMFESRVGRGGQLSIVGSKPAGAEQEVSKME